MKKIMVIVAIILVASILITAASLGICYAAVSKTTVKMQFDSNETYQTFGGFGASSCWYYRMFAKDTAENPALQDQMIEMVYGDTGLKLDIFRYNLGAGSAELKDGKLYADERASTESFFMADKFVNNDSFKDVANYDFTKDADYYGLYKKAVEKGNLKKVVIFSNSPHYLLTVSGMTHGKVEKFNNLKEDAFVAFSNYVLICAKHFKDDLDAWGYSDIEIDLSPVNEPQWKWGGKTDHQEGCHYDPDYLAKFYSVFAAELEKFNKANGTDFKLDMYESGDYNTGAIASSKNSKYLDEFDKYDFFKDVHALSMHSYKAETINAELPNKVMVINKEMRKKYYKFLTKRYGNDKEIRMSEYCVMVWGVDPSIEMGIYSARVLLNDLALLNCTEWTWWLSLAYGGYEDGLVYFDKEKEELWTSYRYHTYKNFMSYIDPGDVRIKADIKDAVGWGGLESVAFKKMDGSIVMVVINDSNKTRNIVVDNLKGTSIEKVVTANNKYLQSSNIDFTNTLTVEAKSVTTFIIK